MSHTHAHNYAHTPILQLGDLSVKTQVILLGLCDVEGERIGGSVMLHVLWNYSRDI